MDGATVIANATNYGCYVASGVTLSVGENASFKYVGSGGLTYSTQSFQSVVIKEGGMLSAERDDSNTTVGALRIASQLSVMDGGSLILTQPSSTGAALQMTSSNATVSMDSPKKVLIMSPKGTTVRFTTGTFSVNTETINLWNTLPSSGIDSITEVPTQIWNQTDGSEFSTSANVSNWATSNVSTTWSGETTLWNSELNQYNYTFSQTKAVLFGTHTISINPVKVNATEVTGYVDPNSEVEIYSGTVLIGSSIADDNGYFSASVDLTGLIEGDKISVLTNHDQLRAHAYTILYDPGALTFVSVPSELNFESGTIPSAPTNISRSANPWVMDISDTRGNGSKWRIDAMTTGQLTDSTGNELNSSLIFKSNSSSYTLSETPVTIYNGTTEDSSDIQLSWDSSQGPSLHLNSISDIKSGVNYSTEINWSLIDAP